MAAIAKAKKANKMGNGLAEPAVHEAAVTVADLYAKIGTLQAELVEASGMLADRLKTEVGE